MKPINKLTKESLNGRNARGQFAGLAGPGRPPGAVSESKKAIRFSARDLLEKPAYLKALQKRLIAGDAGPIEVTLYHYAYGKPVDRVEITEGRPNQALTDTTLEERIRNHPATLVH